MIKIRMLKKRERNRPKLKSCKKRNSQKKLRKQLFHLKKEKNFKIKRKLKRIKPLEMIITRRKILQTL
jgi:hypothetical protein